MTAPIRRLAADPIALAVVATGLVSAFFLVWPGVDIAVSELFYRPDAGFYLADNPWLIALRRSNDVAMVTLIAAVLASLGAKLRRPQRPSMIPPRASLFLMASLALSAGVLVNLVLKDHWGRPRPTMVDVFGGTAPYVPVWRIADYCHRNCSFVSGEASTAIWLVGLAVVVPARWRMTTAIVTVAYAAAASTDRIVFGGHFLSDVLLAWCLTLLVMAVVYTFVYGDTSGRLTDARLDAALARVGRALGFGGPEGP